MSPQVYIMDIVSVHMVEVKVGAQLTHLGRVNLLLQEENKYPELRSYQPHKQKMSL